MVTPARDQKTKALVVATKCTSVEQFVATFHRFCDDSSFFVSTLAERPIGLETAFSIQLEDKTPVLRGLCEVVEAWSTPLNRFGRPGVRLSVRRLTSESLRVFKMLQDARVAAEAALLPVTIARTPTGATPRLPAPIPALPPRAAPDPRVSDAPSLPRHSDRSGPVVAPTVTVPPVLMKPPGMTVSSVVPPRSVAPRPPVVSAPAVVVPAVAEPLPSIIVDDAAAAPERIAPGDELTTPVAVESRAPGSSLVLPANPLMNLTDQSLGGFVDCALYEETGNFFRAPGYEDSLVDIDPVAPPPEALSPVNAIRQGPSTAPPMLSPTAFAPAPPQQPPPPDHQFSPEATPLPMLAPPRDQTAPRYSQPLVTDDAVPVAAPSASPSPIHSTASHPEMPASGRRWWILLGGAAVIAASVLLVMVLARGDEDEPTAPPVKVASATPSTPAEHEPTTPPSPDAAPSEVSTGGVVEPTRPAPAAKIDPPDDSVVPPETSDDPSGPPVVGSGPCRVTVSSTPAGSIVRIDDQIIGPSPVTFDGLCKRRKVDVKHPRYALGTKFVNLSPDKPVTVEVPLARPTHAITIMTMPPGATISIGGNRAGTTPTSVKIMGFTGVTLTVEKKGYKTVVQKVYSKVDQDRIMLKLVRK